MVELAVALMIIEVPYGTDVVTAGVVASAVVVACWVTVSVWRLLVIAG